MRETILKTPAQAYSYPPDNPAVPGKNSRRSPETTPGATQTLTRCLPLPFNPRGFMNQGLEETAPYGRVSSNPLLVRHPFS
jgi:hypothetical protein